MNILKGVAFDTKIPIIIDGDQTDDNKMYSYDGKQYKYITHDEYKQIRSLRTPFIPIMRDKDDKIVNEKYDKTDKQSRKMIKKDLKQIHTEFLGDAEYLLKETKGLINMYKSGRDTKTAIQLAYHYLNINEMTAEQITVDEYKWIESASYGALLFGEEYSGKAWKYDINSSYPSVYSSNNFLVPVKKGLFQKIASRDFLKKCSYVPYGIYRCKIEYNNNENNHKVFKLNQLNYYTSIDINYAHKLKFKITLIEDDEYNFLQYKRSDCKTGNQLFSDFVKKLYPMRSNPLIKSRVKKLLNKLWGGLCERNEFTKIYNEDEECILLGDCEVVEMNPCGENLCKIKYVKTDQPYETNYGRMKCFLLAKARLKISEYIMPFKDHVMRCHTDSLTSDIELPIEHSLELGKVKVEKSGSVVIKHSLLEVWKEE